MTDLFGGPAPKPRGKHYVQPWGYVAPPGTGPAGETCRSCKHIVRDDYAGRFFKCGLNRGQWSHGRKTDILSRSPACAKWEPPC